MYVTGTFDDWKKSEQLNKVGEHFEKDVTLNDASKKIYYKVGTALFLFCCWLCFVSSAPSMPTSMPGSAHPERSWACAGPPSVCLASAATLRNASSDLQVKSGQARQASDT